MERPTNICGYGGIGRRAWFRSMFSQGSGGSSPLLSAPVTWVCLCAWGKCSRPWIETSPCSKFALKSFCANHNMFESDIGEDREHSGSFVFYFCTRFTPYGSCGSQHDPEIRVPVKATIQSCNHTVGGYQETIRVEIWYSYRLNESDYAGRLIRDRVLAGVRKVVNQYPPDKDVFVRVNPADASESYLPSGIGYVEPFFVGVVSLGTIAILMFILSAFVPRC